MVLSIFAALFISLANTFPQNVKNSTPQNIEVIQSGTTDEVVTSAKEPEPFVSNCTNIFDRYKEFEATKPDTTDKQNVFSEAFQQIATEEATKYVEKNPSEDLKGFYDIYDGTQEMETDTQFIALERSSKIADLYNEKNPKKFPIELKKVTYSNNKCYVLFSINGDEPAVSKKNFSIVSLNMQHSSVAREIGHRLLDLVKSIKDAQSEKKVFDSMGVTK